MEYADFLKLGWDNNEPNFFLNYFNWLLENDFEYFKTNLLNSVDMKKFQRRSEDDILLSSLITKPQDYEKRLKQKQFYHSNAQCAHIVFRAIFDEDLFKKLKDDRCIPAVRNNYQHIMKSLLLDIMDMENAYNYNINSNTDYDYNIGKIVQPTMPFHQILRQNLFGQFSFNSFTDMEISYAISIIRQLIELRIRRAFALLSVENGNTLIPINFTSILEAIEEHINDITFSVDFKLIKNIYIWSNMYVHSGLKHFAWIPYSIEFVLRPLTFGETNSDRGWNINNGVKVKEETIKSIHRTILDGFHDNENLKISKYKYECEIII